MIGRGILVFSLFQVAVFANHLSPCPEVLRYEENLNEPGKWYGIITIKSPETLNGVWLRIILDKPAESLSNWFGEVTTADNRKFIIKQPEYKLESGASTTLRFAVKYGKEKDVPKIQEILINAKTVCKVGDEFINGKEFNSKVVEKAVFPIF